VAAADTESAARSALNHLKEFLRVMEAQSKSASDLLATGREQEGLTKFGDLLWEMNRFLYVHTQDLEPKWISRYHEVWARFAPSILQLRINNDSCLKVAQVFEKVHSGGAGRYKAPQERSAGLSKEQIANVRFVTAAQDWKLKQTGNPYEIARQHPDWFDPKRIASDPETAVNQILGALGVRPDQGTKRVDYARNGAQFLIQHYDGSAYNLGPKHHFDAAELREALVEPDDPAYLGHIGFSYKKADMFIRDMYDFDVWRLQRIEALDVPPDINTMRAAIRTGILHGPKPFLTSYLDIYSSQYELVAGLTSQAWRKVWERWGELPDNHRVEGPAFFDFLLYEVLSRECALLVTAKVLNCRRCASSSLVKARVRTCPNCGSTNTWTTRERGTQDQFRELIHRGCGFCGQREGGSCVFDGIITFDRWSLAPPKSISRIGGTGWDDGYTTEHEGGGGITS
jgi:hypothetical protein